MLLIHPEWRVSRFGYTLWLERQLAYEALLSCTNATKNAQRLKICTSSNIINFLSCLAFLYKIPCTGALLFVCRDMRERDITGARARSSSISVLCAQYCFVTDWRRGRFIFQGRGENRKVWAEKCTCVGETYPAGSSLVKPAGATPIWLQPATSTVNGWFMSRAACEHATRHDAVTAATRMLRAILFMLLWNKTCDCEKVFN